MIIWFLRLFPQFRLQEQKAQRLYSLHHLIGNIRKGIADSLEKNDDPARYKRLLGSIDRILSTALPPHIDVQSEGADQP